jgi:outer membrane autotransporter protein
MSFQAAPFVDNFCGQPSLDFDPGGPFAIYNNQVPGASIAVLGSLAYTESAPAPAGAAETTMMANRGALILSNGLDTRQRIERLQNGTAVSRETLSFEDVPLVTGSPVGLALDEDRMNFVAGADWGGTMVWAEGSIATLNDDATDDARFAILHIGADWLLNADTSLGVAAQFDSYSENDFISGAEFSGRGWMIGPVLTSRIADRLFLDARLAYGRADNDARRSGGTDEFDSERALAELSVTGQLSHGGYSIFPDAEIAYFSETSDSYSSATLGQVDGKRVSLGQARLGALIERPFEMSANGTAIAFADFGSVYTRRYEGSLIEGAFADEIEGWSGEAELGLRYTSRGGASLDASIGVGGLFANAESYSATLAVRIPLP